MSDFNADNAKIDAALAALAAGVPYVKLLDVTTTEDVAQVDLDVSAIDLTQYHRLDIFFTPGVRGTGYANQLYLRLNGIDTGYRSGSTNSSFNYITSTFIGGADGTSAVACTHLYPGETTAATTESVYFITETATSSSFPTGALGIQLSATELQTLNLVGFYGYGGDNGYRSIGAGLRIRVYGLRK
jgi:hypothetical protein